MFEDFTLVEIAPSAGAKTRWWVIESKRLPEIPFEPKGVALRIFQQPKFLKIYQSIGLLKEKRRMSQ